MAGLTDSLPPLSDTGRATVLRVARLLSQGYTGKMVIDALEGGVRDFTVGQKWTGETLVTEELVGSTRSE